MAPSESHRACDLKKLSQGEYANCHRFDQSALAILLYQRCSKSSNDYVEHSPLIDIERLGAPPP